MKTFAQKSLHMNLEEYKSPRAGRSGAPWWPFGHDYAAVIGCNGTNIRVCNTDLKPLLASQLATQHARLYLHFETICMIMAAEIQDREVRLCADLMS